MLNEGLPVKIRNASSGRYSVRIERDGYVPFEKIVEVKPEQTTKIKIQLATLKSSPVCLLS